MNDQIQKLAEELSKYIHNCQECGGDANYELAKHVLERELKIRLDEVKLRIRTDGHSTNTKIRFDELANQLQQLRGGNEI